MRVPNNTKKLKVDKWSFKKWPARRLMRLVWLSWANFDMQIRPRESFKISGPDAGHLKRRFRLIIRTEGSERYLFAVLASRRVEALDEVGGVAEEQGVASGSADHGEHGEPHVGERLRREAAVPDAQHVRHGFEEGPRVLLEPERLLFNGAERQRERETEKKVFINTRDSNKRGGLSSSLIMDYAKRSGPSSINGARGIDTTRWPGATSRIVGRPAGLCNRSLLNRVTEPKRVTVMYALTWPATGALAADAEWLSLASGGLFGPQSLHDPLFSWLSCVVRGCGFGKTNYSPRPRLSNLLSVGAIIYDPRRFIDCLPIHCPPYTRLSIGFVHERLLFGPHVRYQRPQVQCVKVISNI